ncbi:hypothetical protein WA158_004622 [Blastocystis sp. Blastoise]
MAEKDYSKMTIIQLKTELGNLGLSTTGAKTELIDRLNQYEDENKNNEDNRSVSSESNHYDNSDNDNDNKDDQQQLNKNTDDAQNYSSNYSEQQNKSSNTTKATVYNPSAVNPANPDGLPKIFVGGLHSEITDDMLRDYFKQFGEVVACNVVRDKATGKSKGFGFVQLASHEIVDEILSHTELKIRGKKVDVRRQSQEMKKEDAVKYKIHVSGLTDDMSNDDITAAFNTYGKVTEISILRNDNGSIRGFGFIRFDNTQTVDNLLQLQSINIKGHEVSIHSAKNKKMVTPMRNNMMMGMNNQYIMNPAMMGMYNPMMYQNMMGVNPMAGMTGMAANGMAGMNTMGAMTAMPATGMAANGMAGMNTMGGMTAAGAMGTMGVTDPTAMMMYPQTQQIGYNYQAGVGGPQRNQYNRKPNGQY